MTSIDKSPRRTSRSWKLGVGIAAVLVTIIGLVAWWNREPNDLHAQRLLDAAQTRKAARDFVEAERLARRAFSIDRTLVAAALLAKDCAVERGDFQAAADRLLEVNSTDTNVQANCQLMAAELIHRHLYRLSEAETQYRAVLKLQPDHALANLDLANLLALCGRRREAIPFALQLVRQDINTDLLILLASTDGVINDRPALEQARAAAPHDPNPLLGLAWHAIQAEKFDEASTLLLEILRRTPDHPGAHSAWGQVLLATNRWEDLVEWTKGAPQAADLQPEVWLVRAKLAEHFDDKPGAIRCYWESARLAPETMGALFQLTRLLSEARSTSFVEPLAAQVHRMHDLDTLQNQVLFTHDHEDADSLLKLAKAYESAGRLWEAYGWCRLAMDQETTVSEPKRRSAEQMLQRLRQRTKGLPLQLVADAHNVVRSIDLSSYPLPRFGSAVEPSKQDRTEPHSGTLSFRNDSDRVGLKFRYFNGTSGPPSKRMFELTGGGIGVLDYDLDGFPDAYFSQGRVWGASRSSATADTSRPAWRDRLYRNRRGLEFEDVTDQANVIEDGFGQGVAIGDFNADGFPDVYVGNIGGNQLWLNAGDGTFQDITSVADVAGSEWTTSCVMADLNTDGLPDIYAVSYVTAPDVFDRICRHPDGSPMQCRPFEFDGQRDRFWLNDGDGHFTDATSTALSINPNGMGLGVAAWDAHDKGRLSLLVANDTTCNFFFVNDGREGAPFQLRECAVESGLAFNADGKATACMGIALGDLNDDGRQDTLITNFLGEPNTLFISPQPGFFEDRTRRYGLYEPSLNQLGFGTQFLDADLDGDLELFVANGHVDDLRKYGRPYRMPPQLFQLNGQRLQEVDAKQLGSYFQQDWLGRSVVRVDWNRDGKEDLIVGHLDDDSALLTNTSPTSGHSVAIRLCGIASSRDAIGARVTAKRSGQVLHRQLCAGDGYQASNERRVVIGLGSANAIEELQITWPSGTVQQFREVPASREFCLREGGELIELTRDTSDR